MNAKTQRELHDLYSKHDIYPVIQALTVKMGQGLTGTWRFGMCDCGRSYIWIHSLKVWEPLDEEMVAFIGYILTRGRAPKALKASILAGAVRKNMGDKAYDSHQNEG